MPEISEPELTPLPLCGDAEIQLPIADNAPKLLPLCKVCNQPVDMSLAGKVANSNGNRWHGFCYKTQEKLDQYKAAWDECVERLKARADLPPKVKALEWEDSTYSKHEGCREYAETPYGTYFICYDSDDFSGFYCDFVSAKDLTWFGSGSAQSQEIISHHHDDDFTFIKAAVQAHHEAIALACLE